MKKSLMLSAVLVCLFAGQSVLAAETFVIKGKGSFANAFATIQTPFADCSVTENIGIQPFDNTFKMLGNDQFSQSNSIAFIYYERSGCGLAPYSFNNYDFLEIPEPAFVVNKLSSAKLDVTVLVKDNLENIFPVHITTDWSDVGKKDLQHDEFITGSDPKSIFNYRQKVQPATANFSMNGYGVSVSGSTGVANIIQLIDGNKVIFH